MIHVLIAVGALIWLAVILGSVLTEPSKAEQLRREVRRIQNEREISGR